MKNKKKKLIFIRFPEEPIQAKMTIGKAYKLYKSWEGFITIKDDTGIKTNITRYDTKLCFITIEEYRKIKIEKILRDI